MEQLWQNCRAVKIMQKAYCEQSQAIQLSTINIGLEGRGFKNFQEILTIEKNK